MSIHDMCEEPAEFDGVMVSCMRSDGHADMHRDVSENIEWFKLYHFTTPENAQKIHTDRVFRSREVYASNRPDGRCLGYYGDAVVCLTVRAESVIPDDSFRTGEKFYRIPADKIESGNIRWIGGDK